MGHHDFDGGWQEFGQQVLAFVLLLGLHDSADERDFVVGCDRVGFGFLLEVVNRGADDRELALAGGDQVADVGESVGSDFGELAIKICTNVFACGEV